MGPDGTRQLPEKSCVKVASLPSACTTTIFVTESTKIWPVPFESWDSVTAAPFVCTFDVVDVKNVSPGLTTGWLAQPPVRPRTPPTLAGAASGEAVDAEWSAVLALAEAASATMMAAAAAYVGRERRTGRSFLWQVVGWSAARVEALARR